MWFVAFERKNIKLNNMLSSVYISNSSFNAHFKKWDRGKKN